MGLVGMCSAFESGGERYDMLISNAEKAMKEAGIDVVVAERSVWNPSDAIRVCDQFKKESVTSLAMIFVTWVQDSLPYIFMHELSVPTVFWAVPFPETFSIGCVQNFGSALKTQNTSFEYVYGNPEDKGVMDTIVLTAEAGEIIRDVKEMRIALVGPRQTWRVAGPQDMSKEEWDFSEKLGPTILHIEMEEITDKAEKISDAEAEKILNSLKGRTGKVKCSHETMLWMAKVYSASKEIIEAMHLQAFAAECYPYYSGLMNQAASWLSDDGYVVDTEGDIAHVFTQYILNRAAGSGTCALGEVGSYNEAENYMTVCHEGSTAASLADSIEKVAVNPSGDRGAFIGVPLKAMDRVTFCDMQGVDGSYQMMVATGSTLPVSEAEWTEAGEKLVAKLRADQGKPAEVIDQMIRAGFHHHFVIREGDVAELTREVCKFLGISVVTLG